MDMEVDCRRKRGRPKTRWRDCIVVDGREKNVELGMIENRIRWRNLMETETPHRNRIIRLQEKRLKASDDLAGLVNIEITHSRENQVNSLPGLHVVDVREGR
ncbi:hypothetical protein E2C01_001905 [Portunus trituberculatus]|uniref:Uncharacterized protein n=1 Tax=Portunus trituberculatus TaxID=210409 RepID=A0A5B7CIG8_PORTR|nr:hypothetical protein [Portunus trituberculatus]